MADETFTASRGMSLGVELELQLVRPHDLDLGRDAGQLLARLEKRKLPGAVKPEITESMIELNSSVHERCGGLAAELRVMRTAVTEEAGVLGGGGFGGGAPPLPDLAGTGGFPHQGPPPHPP